MLTEESHLAYTVRFVPRLQRSGFTACSMPWDCGTRTRRSCSWYVLEGDRVRRMSMHVFEKKGSREERWRRFAGWIHRSTLLLHFELFLCLDSRDIDKAESHVKYRSLTRSCHCDASFDAYALWNVPFHFNLHTCF